MDQGLRDVASRNLKGGMIAVFSSVFSLLVLGIGSAYFTDLVDQIPFYCLIVIDSSVNSLAILWVNLPKMRRSTSKKVLRNARTADAESARQHRKQTVDFL